MKKLLLMGAILMVGLGNQRIYANKMVQVKGSDTLLSISQYIAEKYMEKNKNARIAVTGGGSGVGISSLLNGTADIGMASRNIKESEIIKSKEKGLELEEVIMGYDGITIVTNKENSIKNLSSESLGKIYRGEIKNWKEVGGTDGEIVVLSRDSSSGTHEFFKDHIIRKGKAKGTEEYYEKTLYLPSNEAIKQEIQSNKNAIGYLGMGYVDNGVKSLDIDSISATKENVLSKKYPIAREIYWYVSKNRTGDTKTIVEYALSPEGQKIVSDEGFVPVK